jgi:CheY-like chemotaxis protein
MQYPLFGRDPMSKILVFDQCRCAGEFYRKEFEEEGYNVLAACSLRDALKCFRNEDPALVLLIIESPGAELLGTIEQMVSINRHVPIVFSSPIADVEEPLCAGLDLLYSERRSRLAVLKQTVKELCPFPAPHANGQPNAGKANRNYVMDRSVA